MAAGRNSLPNLFSRFGYFCRLPDIEASDLTISLNFPMLFIIPADPSKSLLVAKNYPSSVNTSLARLSPESPPLLSTSEKKESISCLTSVDKWDDGYTVESVK